MHVRRWGGRRAGAGRPAKKGERPSERHGPRPALVGHVVHVVARVDEAIAPALRRLGAAEGLRACARALALAGGRVDFRIVHVGVRVAAREASVELIVEAADRQALARGMQGFQVSAARSLNRVVRRRGRVFADRYQARALVSGAARAQAIAGLPASARQLGVFER